MPLALAVAAPTQAVLVPVLVLQLAPKTRTEVWGKLVLPLLEVRQRVARPVAPRVAWPVVPQEQGREAGR